MTKNYLVDLAERVGRTFIQSFAVVFTAGLTNDAPTSTDAWRALILGAATAGLAAVMGMFGRLTGSPDDASFLNPGLDEAPHPGDGGAPPDDGEEWFDD